MSIKSKTTAAAAIAALALPTSLALAHDGERHGKGQERSAERTQKAQEQRSSQKGKSTDAKGRAFVVRGVKATGLSVQNDALAGPITLDPTSANKHARKFLELTKTELRGDELVTFGESGDKVVVKYVGLQSTDALQPTDVVKVIGKVSRDGKELNLRKITVVRPTAEETEQD